MTKTEQEIYDRTGGKSLVSSEDRNNWDSKNLAETPKEPAWNPLTNNPTLASILTAPGDYTEIAAEGFSSLPTGVNEKYEFGDIVIKTLNGYTRRKKASKPSPNSVGVKELDPTLADLNQSLPDDSNYMYVVVDPASRKALAIRKDAVIEGKFDLSQAVNFPFSLLPQEVKNGLMLPGSVKFLNLSSEVSSLLQLPFENDEDMYVVGDLEGRKALFIRKSGVVGGKFDLSQAINFNVDSLPESIKNAAVESFVADNVQYLYVFIDQAGRIALGIRKDGKVYGNFILADNTITENMLVQAVREKLITPAFSRLNAANANLVETDQDTARAVRVAMTVKTLASGTGFARFADRKVKHLRGKNDTGVALQFRQSHNLPLKGLNYKGTFNPLASGFVGLNLKTPRYGNTSVWPPLANPVAGDYVERFKQGSTSEGGLASKQGDLFVFDGTNWGVQISPTQAAPAQSNYPGDFWIATNAGRFCDLNLAVNDRLIYLGIESNGGTGVFPRFALLRAGEFVLMGECNPAAFNPATILEGDLYVLSADGNVQGYAGKTGDYLAYELGTWVLYPANLVTVAAGAGFILSCQNASEWEVRRTDKSPGVKVITAYTQLATLRRRSSDEVVFYSDSMFGTFVAAFIALLTGRNPLVESFGGGTSMDVLTMVLKRILTGDPHAGKLHVFWHGQNNWQDPEQTKEAAFLLSTLAGAIERKFIFWSVLGQRIASYNGNRIVLTIQEAAFAGTNQIAQVEQFYEATFPKQYFSPRKALLNWALTQTTTPDLQFPGKSIADTAALYGAVPLPAFLNYATLPIPAAEWNFVNYTSEAPTGGNHKDYYIRTDAGNQGYFYLNNQGVWTAISFDVTHIHSAFAPVPAQLFSNYLNTNNL